MDAALLPSYLGMDISQHLLSLDQDGLSDIEYINVTTAIGYLTTTEKQQKFADFLMTLPRNEILSRSAKITKLVNILDNFKNKKINDL